MPHHSIIIVDDMQETTYRLKNIVESNGMEVILSSENGYELISKIQQYKPDIVLSSIYLEKLNIMDVFISTHRTENTPPIFIVLAEIGGYKIEKELLETGIEYCFTKPIIVENVAKRIFKITSSLKHKKVLV